MSFYDSFAFDDDDGTLPFGKYRGSALQDVEDSSYLRWMLTVASPGPVAQFAASNRDRILAVLNERDNAKAASAPPILVTPHQQAASDKIFGQIMNGANVVRLDGGAGYGKSYTVKHLLTALRTKGFQAQACAVSYVATQVLARDLEPYGFETKTVAKTLQQRKVLNADTGADDYVLTEDSYATAAKLLSPGRCLVADECSMLNDEVARCLMDAANTNGGHLILVGDDHQLPPVKQETISIACQTPDPATLTEPMRYPRESALFGLEQLARHNPAPIPQAVRHTSDPSIVHLPRVDALAEVYASNFRNDPQAAHRLLMFRRTDVVAANNHIRSHLYGSNPALVEDGERLMVLRTSDYPFIPNAKVGDTVRYYSGESFVVTAAEPQTYTTSRGHVIPHWTATFQDRRDPVRVVFAVTESAMDADKRGGPEYEAAMRDAFAYGRETKDWTALKELQGQFVSVAYQYATSVHRAQGQTTDYAYVAPGQLWAVPGLMGRALAYVALTRARKQCTIVI